MKGNLFTPDEIPIYDKYEAESKFLKEARETEAAQKHTLDPESKKIYEASGVDTGKPHKETLAGQEYEVYINPNIDPELKCEDGLTNIERMQRGLAPYIEVDGKLVKIELHHDQQKHEGPLVELDKDSHDKYSDVLHKNTGKGEGRGDDSQWDQKRAEHWRNRAADFL